MDRTSRILIIPSWYPPDGGYFFKEHSEAIRQTGWQVDVLVIRMVGIRKLLQAGPRALLPPGTVMENGLRVQRHSYLKVPGSEKYNIRGWAAKTRRSYKRYEEQFGKPDLILAHSVTWAGYAAFLIREKYGIPYLVVEHRSFFVWSTEEARRMVKPFFLPFFEKAYRNCSQLVLVSESLRRGVEELMPWIVEKIVVIPNMIREDMFLPPPEPRKHNPFHFIWAGRLEHVKGIDLLLEAVRLVMDRTGVPFHVRLAGKGSLRTQLEQRARELGVVDRVHFLGRVSRDEMQKELQGADCFVLPSRYEAFGAVLIEAMATGLPVIATRSGGPDHIVTRECGLLVDPEHPGQLADAMEQMIQKIHEYEAWSIRTLVMERYGQTGVMESYNQQFQRVVQLKP